MVLEYWLSAFSTLTRNDVPSVLRVCLSDFQPWASWSLPAKLTELEGSNRPLLFCTSHCIIAEINSLQTKIYCSKAIRNCTSRCVIKIKRSNIFKANRNLKWTDISCYTHFGQGGSITLDIGSTYRWGQRTHRNQQPDNFSRRLPITSPNEIRSAVAEMKHADKETNWSRPQRGSGARVRISLRYLRLAVLIYNFTLLSLVFC